MVWVEGWEQGVWLRRNGVTRNGVGRGCGGHALLRYEEFMTAVNEWEAQKNKTGGGKQRKATTQQNPTTVQARSSSYLQGRKFLGMLWPVALYRTHFKTYILNCYLIFSDSQIIR